MNTAMPGKPIRRRRSARQLQPRRQSSYARKNARPKIVQQKNTHQRDIDNLVNFEYPLRSECCDAIYRKKSVTEELINETKQVDLKQLIFNSTQFSLTAISSSLSNKVWINDGDSVAVANGSASEIRVVKFDENTFAFAFNHGSTHSFIECTGEGYIGVSQPEPISTDTSNINSSKKFVTIGQSNENCFIVPYDHSELYLVNRNGRLMALGIAESLADRWKIPI